MKTFFFLLSILTTTSIYSQEWEQMSETEDGIYFYRANTYNTAWVKLVSEKTEYYPNKKSEIPETINGFRLMLWKFDCDSKKTGLIQATTYSKDGKVLDSFSQKEFLVDMEYVIPDSLGEEFLKKFCKF